MELIEREVPLAALSDAHASAVRGEGRVALVSGEPGIGKTSLVRAFLETLDVDTKVLQGTCDDLTIARPLGGFSDLLGSVSPALEQAIASGAPPRELHPLLFDELDARSRTTALIVEDVHWADNATLDALTFIARRIRSMRALLVLTLRSGEVPLQHPLRAALGDIPAASTVYVELEPLSRAGVDALSGSSRADHVYSVTRGNPFFVTELLEDADAPTVPASVAHAVLGRAARLEPDARRLVDLVAVVPRRIQTAVLDRAFPEWTDAAEEPERRHLLEVRPRFVAFRHELARAAILAAVPAAARRRLHGDVLAALLELDADPADIVHQAEAAGAEDVVADHVLVAARRAASVHANREAYAHYHRNLDFLDRYPQREQALLLEELADTAQLVGRFVDALHAISHAVTIWRDLGDQVALGRCIAMQSRLHWFVGDGVRARGEAAEAIAILEPHGVRHELATAYGLVARLAMLAADGARARAWAAKEIELATILGDEASRIHAIVTLATLEVESDPSPEPALAAFREAKAAGNHYEALIALANLAHVLIGWGLPAEASVYAEQALEEAEQHELRHLVSHVRGTHALLALRAGRWQEAEEIATREMQGKESVSRMLAETVLTELAVRRGDGDAELRLHELRERAERFSDVEWVLPVLDLLNERALMGAADAPVEELRHLLAKTDVQGQLTVRIAAAAAVAGLGVAAAPTLSTPYSLVAAGDWRAAADAFGAAGWSYDRALMLSLLDDVDGLVEALEIARGLGAAPLEARLVRRLRALGERVPRGPYSRARANPANLTARQLEVLTLIAKGQTNAEIAAGLVVSLRTAEHHVAAVLAKLGTTRQEASSRAADLGVVLTGGAKDP